jgi:ABC-type multidrug transport system ATPase subunit
MITLHVTALGKHFGFRWVFRDLSFSSSASVLGIAGTNGSGKSTLVRCLAGLYRPNMGEIIWARGEHTLSRESIRQYSGYAAPYIQLYGGLSCLENLRLLQLARGETSSDMIAAGWMERAGIPGRGDDKYQSLSSGQQQRMKVISAVQHDPQILFLDEPGSNLDSGGHDFIRRVVEERRQRDYLTIVATNDPSELDLCDTVIRL